MKEMKRAKMEMEGSPCRNAYFGGGIIGT